MVMLQRFHQVVKLCFGISPARSLPTNRGFSFLSNGSFCRPARYGNHERYVCEFLPISFFSRFQLPNYALCCVHLDARFPVTLIQCGASPD